MGYIHPFSSIYLGPGYRGCSLSREAQTPSLATSSTLSRGNMKAFPDQLRDIISPLCPGAAPPELTQEMPRRLPYQVSKAPQLAPFELSHLGEALSKPATLPHRKEPAEVLSLRQRPDTLQRKLISATCSFSVYPELVTIGLCPHLRG